MADPTITGVTNNGSPVPLQGNHYDLCTGTIVVSGSTGFDEDDEGEPIAVTAYIIQSPGGPLPQATPAMSVTYGATAEDGSRTFTATWPSYTVTGSGQALEVKQATEPFGLTGVTVNVH